jgi:hypothetical protein
MTEQTDLTPVRPGDASPEELAELEREGEKLGRTAAEVLGAKLHDLADANELAAGDDEKDEVTLPDEPPRDPRARACTVCQGWGILRTGSGVESQLVRQCWHCNGVGFEEAQRAIPEPVPHSDELEQYTASVAEPAGAWVWPSPGV